MKVVSDLEEILKDVQRPGSYLGGEWNEIRKDPYKVKIKIALAFPDLYEVGMSYLGQKILYFILNSQSDVLAERVFTPGLDLEKKLRYEKIPLFSLENKIPIFNFDILGFSLLYELNYSNILTMLDLSGIPFLSLERNLEYPLIIAGGPASFNPEPVADIFDMFLIGDGEEAFLEIIEKYKILKGELKDKNNILHEMAEIKGVYVPSLYTCFRPPKSSFFIVKANGDVPDKIEKRVLFPFHKSSFPEKVIVPNTKIIFDRVSVEIARGCPGKCRFCQATSLYFPPRVKDPNFVIEKILSNLRFTGYEDASLTSLSAGDYPYLDETIEALMKEFKKENISLSLSSLRPGSLTSKVVKNIAKVRKTGFTIVPEAGTERLRRVINKNLKDSEIWEASRNIFSQGWKLIKLYFMIGLPKEKYEDLEGIVHIIDEVVKIGNKLMKSNPNINLSVSSFIPKPHTPFQWLKMEDEKILKEKRAFLFKKLRKYHFISFKEQSLKSSILEAVFSRGDRSLNSVLVRAWKNGARFDSWSDMFNFSLWEKAFKFEKIDYHHFLSSYKKDTFFPWDHIDTGIKKKYLLQELSKAFEEKTTESCLSINCSDCHGCSLGNLYERSFPEKVRILEQDNPFFGEKTENIFRYRATYEKVDKARFLSHKDLINVIQRSLRRARISTVYSKGFHPKMKISYFSALPLGMEGKHEVLEFKSSYVFSEKQFLSRINKFLPSGVRFLTLKKVDDSSPSLSESIKTLVYSVDLNRLEVKKALVNIRKEGSVYSKNDLEIIDELVNKFLKKSKINSIEIINVDKKQRKIFIHSKFSYGKMPKPKEIIEKILRIKNAVFIISRENVL